MTLYLHLIFPALELAQISHACFHLLHSHAVQVTNSKPVFLTPLYMILHCMVCCNWRLMCIVETGASCHKDCFPVSSTVNCCSVFSCVLCRTAGCLTHCYALCFSCLRVHPPLLNHSRKINNILCCSAWWYILFVRVINRQGLKE